MKKLRRAALAVLFLAGAPLPARAAHAFNDLSLDIPVDGGGMLVYSRSWRVARYIDAGFLAGGGEINRSFNVDGPAGQPSMKARTETLVFPFVGPRVTFVFPIIAVSVGYAAFYGHTNFRVDTPAAGAISGTASGLGTGFFSPLLSIDLYDEKSDLVFGFGLGGFLGTSFPDLVASGGGTTVRSTESPIDTLTVHFKIGWDDGRRARRQEKADEDF